MKAKRLRDVYSVSGLAIKLGKSQGRVSQMIKEGKLIPAVSEDQKVIGVYYK